MSHDREIALWRQRAELLWQLLDDIDTLDDQARDDSDAFRRCTRVLQQRRHGIATSDGYVLTWRPDPTPHKLSLPTVVKPGDDNSNTPPGAPYGRGSRDSPDARQGLIPGAGGTGGTCSTELCYAGADLCPDCWKRETADKDAN